LTMAEYDSFCQHKLSKKIPNWRSRDYRRRMGDCIYDFSSKPEPKLRWSVHSEANRIRDLGGENALLSNYFFYFGDHPIKLPDSLRPIMHTTQGHKSDANQPYLSAFTDWIVGIGYRPNRLYGEPQLKQKYYRETDFQAKCSLRSLEEDLSIERSPIL